MNADGTVMARVQAGMPRSCSSPHQIERKEDDPYQRACGHPIDWPLKSEAAKREYNGCAGVVLRLCIRVDPNVAARYKHKRNERQQERRHVGRLATAFASESSSPPTEKHGSSGTDLTALVVNESRAAPHGVALA